MIEKLTIKNFQCHNDSTLDFVPGVNVIIGDSDKGKSAILKALSWVTDNRPLGNSFISWWSKKSEVSIIVDGISITREKSKTSNCYYIGDREDVYKAMGNDVPETIQNILNISDINYQKQLAAPFLLSSNSGEVARILNKTANLNVIDTAISKINSTLKAEKSELKNKKGLLILYEDQYKEFSDIDDIEKIIIRLEKNEAQHKQLVEDIEDIEDIIEAIEYNKNLISKYDSKLKYEKTVKSLTRMIEKYEDGKYTIKRLSETIEGAKKTKLKIKQYTNKIKYEEDIQDVFKLIERKHSIDDKIKQIKTVYDNIFDAKETIKESKIKESKLNKKFISVVGDTCPLCGQEVDS
jgi:DNA repair exonuclease SbcCD ATPase subunit